MQCLAFAPPRRKAPAEAFLNLTTDTSNEASLRGARRSCHPGRELAAPRLSQRSPAKVAQQQSHCSAHFALDLPAQPTTGGPRRVPSKVVRQRARVEIISSVKGRNGRQPAVHLVRMKATPAKFSIVRVAPRRHGSPQEAAEWRLQPCKSNISFKQ